MSPREKKSILLSTMTLKEFQFRLQQAEIKRGGRPLMKKEVVELLMAEGFSPRGASTILTAIFSQLGIKGRNQVNCFNSCSLSEDWSQKKLGDIVESYCKQVAFQQKEYRKRKYCDDSSNSVTTVVTSSQNLDYERFLDQPLKDIQAELKAHVYERVDRKNLIWEWDLKSYINKTYKVPLEDFSEKLKQVFGSDASIGNFMASDFSGFPYTLKQLLTFCANEPLKEPQQQVDVQANLSTEVQPNCSDAIVLSYATNPNPFHFFSRSSIHLSQQGASKQPLPPSPGFK